MQVILSVKSVITIEIINLPVLVSLSSSLRILPLTIRLLCSSVIFLSSTEEPSKFLPYITDGSRGIDFFLKPVGALNAFLPLSSDTGLLLGLGLEVCSTCGLVASISSMVKLSFSSFSFSLISLNLRWMETSLLYLFRNISFSHADISFSFSLIMKLSSFSIYIAVSSKSILLLFRIL